LRNDSHPDGSLRTEGLPSGSLFRALLRPLLVAVLLLAPCLSGCNGRDVQASFKEGMIDLRPVPWSSQPVSLGKIAAVTDALDDVAVFGSMGAAVFSNGAEVGSDASVTTWKRAAMVPALDLPESWMIGVDQQGRLHRMRNRMVLEDVSARFGLAERPVVEVVALNERLSAFALRDQVAVVDGSKVWFYDINARGLAGAAGRLAAYDWMGVLEVDFTAEQGARIAQLPLEGVIGVAFDVTGDLTLVAATEYALYVEQNGALVKVWDAPEDARITALAGSGRGVWVALGKELALFRGLHLLHGTSGSVPEGGRLVGSPSGDVWVLGGSQLTRMGERSAGGSDEDRWRRSMLPIFNRICRSCHLPTGSASIDLSTYKEWASHRALIKQRLVDQLPTPMPPLTTGSLTYDELAAVKRWTESGM
jgi:hypothetical protein